MYALMSNIEFPLTHQLSHQDGRRVHVALTGIDGIGADKDLSSVLVNGQEGLNLDTSGKADLTYFD